MSHILTIYSEKTPTVHLVLGLIVPFSEQFGTIVREKESGQVTGQDISWCDCVIMIRPYDIVCWDILKAAKQSGRFIIVYLDDDLLNVPDLYASLPRKIIAKLLKKRNQKALIGCLSLCDVLWGSNPLLLDRYQTYVSIGRCVKCDVITDFSKVGPIIERNKGGRILFAGATDHAALLNRYIIPALNQIADRFPDLEMTCIGVTKLQLCECKVAIKYIPWMNDYEQYRKVVEDERCDIGIAVIEKDEFYQCKYFNKILYLIFNYPHKHYTFKHFEV